MKIKQGQIWIATKDFWSSGESHKTKSRRPCKIKILKGERLEVRYPYAWHLRTEDNDYFHITPETLLDSCIFFGTILEDTRFSNRKNLAEIMKEGLYKSSSEIFKEALSV